MDIDFDESMISTYTFDEREIPNDTNVKMELTDVDWSQIFYGQCIRDGCLIYSLTKSILF